MSTADDIAAILADVAFEQRELAPEMRIHLTRTELVALLAGAFDAGATHDVRVAINEKAARGGKEDA